MDASDTLKNILMIVKDADGNQSPLAIGLPGDREIETRRLEAALYPRVHVHSKKRTSPGTQH